MKTNLKFEETLELKHNKYATFNELQKHKGFNGKKIIKVTKHRDWTNLHQVLI